MGRIGKEVAFINNAGGINEAVSPFQMGPDECQAAMNVYFTKYEKYGIISKRKGITKINAVAMDGKIQAIQQFYINNVSYVHAFTDAGKAYSVNMAIGTCTLLQAGLTTTQRPRFAILNNVAFMVNSVDGLMQSTGGVWTAVASASKPAAPIDVTTHQGRLMVLTSTTVFWSKIDDGTYWTTPDSSSQTIDPGDGDTCQAITTIGPQVVVFKRFSIHRMFLTGESPAAYRVEAQYSGQLGAGVGCNCRESLQNCVLENLYSDIWGKAEYIIFASDLGLHALGLQGNALNIDQRIRTSYQNIRRDRLPSCFSMYHSRREQYLLFVPEGSKYTSASQLVFGLRSKSWSKYDWSSMSAACGYVDLQTIYSLIGHKNGYLYKHDWQASDSLSDYSDDGVAISAYWQSQYYDFGNPNRYKEISWTTIRAKETDTDCPITVGVYAESGASASGTIATVATSGSGGRYDTAIVGTSVFASTLGYVDKDVLTKVYCYNASYRFENSGNNQSMDVYGWFTEVKSTNNKNGRG